MKNALQIILIFLTGTAALAAEKATPGGLSPGVVDIYRAGNAVYQRPL
jgi:hypothetical protein